MQEFLTNTRKVGITGGVLLALFMALPWMTVSAPFLGSVSVSGYKSGGDGWVFLGGVVVMAALAFFHRKTLVGVVGTLLASGLVYEYVHAAVSLKSEVSGADDEFSKSIADAVSIQPGSGLILGFVVAAAVATWALVLPRIQARQNVEQPIEVGNV